MIAYFCFFCRVFLDGTRTPGWIFHTGLFNNFRCLVIGWEGLFFRLFFLALISISSAAPTPTTAIPLALWVLRVVAATTTLILWQVLWIRCDWPVLARQFLIPRLVLPTAAATTVTLSIPAWSATLVARSLVTGTGAILAVSGAWPGAWAILSLVLVTSGSGPGTRARSVRLVFAAQVVTAAMVLLVALALKGVVVDWLTAAAVAVNANRSAYDTGRDCLLLLRAPLLVVLALVEVEAVLVLVHWKAIGAYCMS